MTAHVVHQVRRNEGATRRRSLCGKVIVRVAYDPALDGERDEATGIPLGHGTSDPHNTTCRECSSVACRITERKLFGQRSIEELARTTGEADV
jgi:hypothetical protein